MELYLVKLKENFAFLPSEKDRLWLDTWSWAYERRDSE